MKCICPHALEWGADGIFDPLCQVPGHRAAALGHDETPPVTAGAVALVAAALVLGGFWLAVAVLSVVRSVTHER
jgi:hypothetical protein